MASIALYGRADGLFEPRSEKSIEFSKSNAGQMVIVDYRENTRSSLQNKFLNGWIYTHQIAAKLNDAGITVNGIPWTRDTVHAAMQDCFLVTEEFLLQGRHKKVYESTANMSKKRFSEYVGQVENFAREAWEITIDPPRGYWDEVLKEIER